MDSRSQAPTRAADRPDADRTGAGQTFDFDRIIERRGTYNAMQKVDGDLPVAICIGVSQAGDGYYYLTQLFAKSR